MTIKNTYIQKISKILADYSGLYADSLPIELICRYVSRNGASPMRLCLKEIELANFIDRHFFAEFDLNHFHRKINIIIARAIDARQILKKTNEWHQLRNADGYVDFFADATEISKLLSHNLYFYELAQHPFLPFHEESLIDELTKATDIKKNVRNTFNPILRILIWQLKESASNNGNDFDILDMIDDTFNYDIIRFLKGLKASKIGYLKQGKTDSHNKKIQVIQRVRSKAEWPNFGLSDRRNDFRHGFTSSMGGVSLSVVGFYTPEHHATEGDGFTRRTKSVQRLTGGYKKYHGW